MQNELDNGVNRENLEEHAGDMIQPHVVSLGKGQKIAVFVLAFFTLVLMFVGVSNIGSKIKEPNGQYRGENSDKTSQVKSSASDQGVDTDESLRTKDTDGDGINDYEELNVYKTSPYLEDSDSDGYSDGSEIESNNNPNCPNGKDCGVFMDTIKTDSGTDIVSAPKSSNTINSENAPTSSDELQTILSGNSDAKTLRKALLSSGVDPEMLGRISDEDLLRGYRETLNSQK